MVTCRSIVDVLHEEEKQSLVAVIEEESFSIWGDENEENNCVNSSLLHSVSME